MRTTVASLLIVVAVLGGVAGCGDPTNDTNVIVGTTTTPGDGARTPTPARTPTGAQPTPLATLTAGATAIATVTSAGPTATGAAASATPTGDATPGPTATPSGPIDADVQRIAADIVPFLANIDLLTGGSTSALGVHAQRTDECPDGGTRVDDEEAPARTLTFADCRVSDQLGSFEIDGTVVITINGFAGGSIAFDFTLTDLATSRSVAFLGTLPLEIESDGFVLDGPLAVTTPDGGFTLHSDGVTITSARKLVAGEGSITDDGDNFGVQAVEFVVTRRGASSNLTATFDDASVHTYTLDLATGELEQTG